MSGFKLQRLGMIMEPEPGNPHEVEGVLNPGVARGPMANSTLPAAGCERKLLAHRDSARAIQ